jgi:hypothetical protein
MDGSYLPNLPGENLQGHLDESEAAPAKTITQGTGDASVTMPNPAYQKVLGLLLAWIGEDITFHLIDCKTVAVISCSPRRAVSIFATSVANFRPFGWRRRP